MYLGLVRVQNFRNIEDTSVVFKRGLNVLVGENNIGKTNLLDAVRWALGVQAVGRDGVVLIDKEDRRRGADGTYVNQPIHVTLQFEELSDDERADFLEILNYDEAVPEKSTATIHCEWTYSEIRDKWALRRWGGDRKNSEGSVSDELLQALPLTFLEALRDAERELAPGKRSRLARYLQTAATDADKVAVTRIGDDSNKALKQVDLVKRAEKAVSEVLRASAKTDLMREAAIRPASTDFDRLVQTLRVLLKSANGKDDDAMLDGLDSNGLGYNNLIYIATVLAQLEATKDAPLRLLLVEEPEAHLHPQLQTLLASHLAGQAGQVQTILTTHSPTIAAHVEPGQLAIMHRTGADIRRVTRIDGCGLDKKQLLQLRRVLDVTRASLLFAQGVILVEGISECLLLPSLAARLDIDLAKRAVAVVPVGGVDFASIGRLFGNDKIAVPLSILTDADPEIENDQDHWKKHLPEVDETTGKYKLSPRAVGVQSAFGEQATVCVAISELTLEYDMAVCSINNALCMFDAWASCYATKPKQVGRIELEECKNDLERALILWRAVCRGSPQHGKAELAQALASALVVDEALAFKVPDYIERAIRHAARIPKV